METVIALRRSGLEFAVAPVPAAGGQALAPLGDGNAVTVFPYIDGASGDFGAGLPEGDRFALIGVLARLHGATPLARRTALACSPIPASPPRWRPRSVSWASRGAAAPTASPRACCWPGIPPAWAWALARFDELVLAAAKSGPAVITHGEPHPGNIMRGGGRLLLIDWDTVGLALPERDLWLAAGDDAGAAARYAELTGRGVSGAAMDLYRLRWSLDDIALAVRDFRAPHGQNEDTGLMWEAITEEIGGDRMTGTGPPDRRQRFNLRTSRMEAFSDGIFAIATPCSSSTSSYRPWHRTSAAAP